MGRAAANSILHAIIWHDPKNDVGRKRGYLDAKGLVFSIDTATLDVITSFHTTSVGCDMLPARIGAPVDTAAL
jgi:hypothetical protein